MDDQSIIELYWSRDEQAIEQTKAKYTGYCRSIALGILGSAQDTEECLNDTFLSAWNSIPPVRPEKLGIYLGRIVRNKSLSRVRQLNRLKRGGGACDAALSELEDCLSDGITVEQHSDSKAISQAISDYLYSLPSEQRVIFVRRYWYFDTITDIAKRFGMTESKVKSMLFRTRNRLKVKLESEGISI